MDRRISLLRVIACFLVILLHVAAKDFHEFGSKWWPANLWDSLARVCVPLFFMVSGAGLLGKDEALLVFFRKRFTRVLLPLIFWSLVYAAWLEYKGDHVSNWLLAILSGPRPWPLWYLYALVGLYAFVPILSRFFRHSTRGEQLFFLVIWFVVSSLYPTTVALLSGTCAPMELGVLADIYHLQHFGGYLGFFLLGAFLWNAPGSLLGGASLYLAASVGTALGTYALSRSLGGPCSLLYAYSSPLVVMASVGLFLAFRGMASSEPPRWLAVLADCTLGIYCLHMLVLDLHAMSGLGSLGVGRWLAPIAVTASVFAVCFALVFLARKVRLVRFVT